MPQIIAQNILREIREKQSKTILEVSRLAFISPSDISQIELGKKPCFPNWRKRLSKVLNVPESELFPDLDVYNNHPEGVDIEEDL